MGSRDGATAREGRPQISTPSARIRPQPLSVTSMAFLCSHRGGLEERRAYVRAASPRPRSRSNDDVAAVEMVGGRYCEDCQVSQVTDGLISPVSPRGQALCPRSGVRQGALVQERGDGGRTLLTHTSRSKVEGRNGAND
jgi:hypothetical protein